MTFSFTIGRFTREHGLRQQTQRPIALYRDPTQTQKGKREV